MGYTNQDDERKARIYKFSRGVEMLMAPVHLEIMRQELPEGTEIHTEPSDDGWFKARVAEPVDMPVPDLGERTVDLGRYTLKHPWPVDATVNGGGSGLVLQQGDSYRTAFVEASLTEPPTFLRGEAGTIEEAEEVAWAKYQRYMANDHKHEFETRGYDNGAGFCRHCGMFQSKVFSLKEIGSVCHICGEDMYCTIGERMFCRWHAPDFETRKKLRAEARANGEHVSRLTEAIDRYLEDDR